MAINANMARMYNVQIIYIINITYYRRSEKVKKLLAIFTICLCLVGCSKNNSSTPTDEERIIEALDETALHYWDVLGYDIDFICSRSYIQCNYYSADMYYQHGGTIYKVSYMVTITDDEIHLSKIREG